MAFDFGVGFQRSALRLCMVDEAFCAKAIDWLDVDHFTTEPLGWIFAALKRYWVAYSRRCTDVPLRESLRYASAEKHALYAGEVEAVIALGNVIEAPYIKHELQEFVRKQLFAVAHADSGALWNQGKLDEAYDTMATAQERIIQVRFEEVDRQWYFEELRDRYRGRIADHLSAENETFRTGLLPLDNATGGVQLGELWVVFAYAKRCKTTWLMNMGWSATYVDCEPTIHFVLEGKGAQIAAKYDARFGNALYSDVKNGEMDATTYRHLQDDFVRRRRLLVIRTLNDWDINVLHLQAELASLKAGGFVPRMCILDYMDLGRMRGAGASVSETQHQVGFARDFKRLLLQHDMAGWSAWQAQRPKEGANDREHILTSSQVADAYAKVRIVDAYGSLNATDEEMKLGKMRLFWESYRDAPVNQVYRITNDLSRAKMLTSWETYDPHGKEDAGIPPAPSGSFSN